MRRALFILSVCFLLTLSVIAWRADAYFHEDVLLRNYASGPANRCYIDSPNNIAWETFQITEDQTINRIDISARTETNPSSDPFDSEWKMEIYNNAFGILFHSTTIDPNEFSTGYANRTFLVDSWFLKKGSYNLVIYPDQLESNAVWWQRQGSGTDSFPDDHAECTHPTTIYDQAVFDMYFKLYGYINTPNPLWSLAFGYPAYAATCEFVTTAATTTASCSDPIITNTNQDIGLGLFMFFITFFGLLFYFKK